MKKLFLLFAALFSAFTANAAPVQLDVLVLYTPGTVTRYNGDVLTRFKHLMDVTNQIYTDSGVNARVRMVGAEKVNYTDDNNAEVALRAMTTRSDAAFANVPAWRQKYGADLIVLYRPYKDVHGSCGIAWVGGNGTNGSFPASSMKETAYAHVAVDTCGDYVTAHEFGHNMGLLHSRLQDGRGGTFPYALGYGVYGKFTTIMAYQSSFGVDYVAGKIWKFSSPSLTCMGVPCGVDKNNASSGADAVSTLNVTIPQVAQYYPTVVPATTAGGTTTTTNSQIAALQQQLKDAQTKQSAALTAYNSALAAFNAKNTELTTAKTKVTSTYNAAVSAINAVNVAVANFNAASAARASATQLQSLYNAYVAAAQKANTAVTAYNAAVATAQQLAATVATLQSKLTQAKQALDALIAQVASIQSQLKQLGA